MPIEVDHAPYHFERTHNSWSGELLGGAEGISIAGGRDADHEHCKNHQHNSQPLLAIPCLYHLCPPLSVSTLRFEVRGRHRYRLSLLRDLPGHDLNGSIWCLELPVADCSVIDECRGVEIGVAVGEEVVPGHHSTLGGSILGNNGASDRGRAVTGDIELFMGKKHSLEHLVVAICWRSYFQIAAGQEKDVFGHGMVQGPICWRGVAHVNALGVHRDRPRGNDRGDPKRRHALPSAKGCYNIYVPLNIELAVDRPFVTA